MAEMRIVNPVAQDEDETWKALEARLQKIEICQLQAYWADAVGRGCDAIAQGPEWAAERNRAEAQAAAGNQRAASNPKRGLHPLIIPGLHKEEHIARALRMQSPPCYKACRR